MLALASREARRLARLCGGASTLAFVVASLLLAGCAHGREAGSLKAGREPDPALLDWLVSHEPSRLDLSGFSLESVRRSDFDARVRVVSDEPRAACRQAQRDHALLLIFAPARQPERRSAALDCGFALWRDERAVVVAPR